MINISNKFMKDGFDIEQNDYEDLFSEEDEGNDKYLQKNIM